MKARELYPDCEEHDYFYPSGDYMPIIRSFGNVLIHIEDSAYQGDSRVLLEKGGKYGYLIFGWGSCSGCDALLGCNSYEEIDDLMQSFENSIKWFDTLQELQAYFRAKDWELDWSFQCDEGEQFVKRVINYEH